MPFLTQTSWCRHSCPSLKNQQSAKIIDAVIEDKIQPMYTPEIIAEYKEVLSRDKFHFLSQTQTALIEMIEKHGINSDRKSFNSAMPDESDRVFYEVALSKDDSYLVTGNLKHFPVTPIVVTPAEMLDILSHE